MNRTLFFATAVAVALLSGCGSDSDDNKDNSQVPSSAAVVSETERESGHFFSVNWSSPAFDAEGAAVSSDDISGYQVRYRSAQHANADYQVLNTAASQTSIEIATNPGVYEVAVAAVDQEGVTGEYIDPVYVQVGE